MAGQKREARLHAGDPAIHLPKENTFLMNARVKPGHDVS
jgi:hypothetical protein